MDIYCCTVPARCIGLLPRSQSNAVCLRGMSDEETSEMNPSALALPSDYTQWLASLKQRIQGARQTGAHALPLWRSCLIGESLTDDTFHDYFGALLIVRLGATRIEVGIIGIETRIRRYVLVKRFRMPSNISPLIWMERACHRARPRRRPFPCDRYRRAVSCRASDKYHATHFDLLRSEGPALPHRQGPPTPPHATLSADSSSRQWR